MINTQNTLILIVDIQEKLVNMLEKDTVSEKVAKLLEIAGILDIQAVITEQYPKGLGNTLSKLKQKAPENTVFFEKICFSAMQEAGFKEIIKKFNKKNILVCGIEGHVCVYQTITDLLIEGYSVELMKDITVSRSEFDLNIGIEKLKQLGAKVTSFEIALFELLKTAKHPNFKEIQKLIK